ncbi:MAG: aspartate aminotransferase family protein [Candidatus Woesearchaeota archaeon]
MKIQINTKIPGSKSSKILSKLKRLNGGFSAYPIVCSSEGLGCYFKDIDGNTFLDFACQIASNPLGYGNKELNEVIRRYRKQPVKYAGQDFVVEEHLRLLEELLSITPPGLNAGFLINSGAEAVENCIKIALRKQKQAKFGISFHAGFHGRTLGALSCTNSKAVQKKNFFSIPVKRLPYTTRALDELNRLLAQELSAKEIGFIIVEAVQGEGGYNVAPKELMKGLRNFTKQYDIPLILDEIQAGMGRTGKWWAFQNFNLKPDIMSSGKALQVGAAVTNKKLFPVETGSLSSTWGGGHLIDLAVGAKTIRIIKKRKLLNNINRQGVYIKKRLDEIQERNPSVSMVRGLGLMVAFDLSSRKMKNNVIIECLKHGLVLLGCAEKGIRVIPPYIVSRKEIDEGMNILEKAIKRFKSDRARHTGQICNYLTCGERST